MPCLLQLLRSWRGASGYTIKPGESNVIAFGEHTADYEAVIAQQEGALGRQVVRHARYLGAEMRPEACTAQWATVCGKLCVVFPDVVSAPSLAGRILLFKAYIESLVQLRSQFFEPDTEVLAAYAMPRSASYNMFGML